MEPRCQLLHDKFSALLYVGIETVIIIEFFEVERRLDIVIRELKMQDGTGFLLMIVASRSAEACVEALGNFKGVHVKSKR